MLGASAERAWREKRVPTTDANVPVALGSVGQDLVGLLCTRAWGERDGDRLGAQETDECASGLTPAPIAPQDRLRWGRQLRRPLWRWSRPFNGSYHSAHAARSLGPLSLTLWPQGTAPTSGEPCGVEHTHGIVVLRAACFRIEGVTRRTAQCSIWLWFKVRCLPAELRPRPVDRPAPRQTLLPDR